MLEPESYWTRKGPAIPEAKDLPHGTTNGGEDSWNSLSPGMRRTVWREALRREAIERKLPEELRARIYIATISGSLPTLDQYIEYFERLDAARSPLAEDAERLQRADAAHQKGETQIAARETL